MLEKIKKRLHEVIQSGELENHEIIQLIELLGSYLNLETMASRSKRLNIDYNCVKKSSIYKIELFGVKFVIENN
jgi:phosphotransferase system IIB component